MTDPPEKIDFAEFDKDEKIHLSEPARREWVRVVLAVGLLGVFVLELVYVGLSIPLGWMTFDQAKDFFAFVSGPTIGLLGPVAGFYYSNANR